MTKISMFHASPLSTVLVSQITQVVEGKKTKNFESIQIPDVYKVGGVFMFVFTKEIETFINYWTS